MLGAINNHSVILPESIHGNLNSTFNTDFNLSRSYYNVRPARELSPLHAKASNLVASMYSSRGLGIAGSDLSVGQPDRRRRVQTTLAATRGDDVVGTLTLEVDPGNKLLADSLYRRETDALREQGKRLCEVTRLALHPELSCREVMATLFHVTFILATLGHHRTDMLAEVHPRHAGFYRRTLGFKVLGSERICLRVGAPAVLMHLCLDFAQSQISQLAGTCARGDRNLYSLFLPDHEQQSLLKQLCAL